jgi:hypothetical protein
MIVHATWHDCQGGEANHQRMSAGARTTWAHTGIWSNTFQSAMATSSGLYCRWSLAKSAWTRKEISAKLPPPPYPGRFPRRSEYGLLCQLLVEVFRMKNFKVRRFPPILLGLCLLTGACRSVDAPPANSDGNGFYMPPQANAMQSGEAKPSWLQSWFGSEEQGPAKSIDEFMSLERPD